MNFESQNPHPVIANFDRLCHITNWDLSDVANVQWLQYYTVHRLQYYVSCAILLMTFTHAEFKQGRDSAVSQCVDSWWKPDICWHNEVLDTSQTALLLVDKVEG